MIIIQTKPYQLHTPKRTYTHIYMLHCNLNLIAFNVHSLVDKIFYKLYLENHKKINAPYLMTILHVVLYNHPSHKDPLFKMHFILFFDQIGGYCCDDLVMPTLFTLVIYQEETFKTCKNANK